MRQYRPLFMGNHQSFTNKQRILSHPFAIYISQLPGMRMYMTAFIIDRE